MPELKKQAQTVGGDPAGGRGIGVELVAVGGGLRGCAGGERERKFMC